MLGCKGGYDRTRHCNATRGNIDVAIKVLYRALQTPDQPEKIRSNQPLIAVSACPMTSSVRGLVNGKSSS